jgi:hypothetical protein
MGTCPVGGLFVLGLVNAPRSKEVDDADGEHAEPFPRVDRAT